MTKTVIIPIGSQGMGKSTLFRILDKELDVFHISQHGYSSESEMLRAVKCEADDGRECRIMYIDRCNVREKSRNDIIDLLPIDSRVILVDFINTNNRKKLILESFKRARDRPQEGQSIKYNPINGGIALKKVITKKIEQYERPMSDNVSDIINVDLTAMEGDAALAVLSII